MTDKTMWEGDGTTFRIKSDNVVVLETPFSEIAEHPEQVLGKDPATGLPKFCTPKPQVVTIETPVSPVEVPDPPPLPDTWDPCVRARCGAATALRDKIVEDYAWWRNAINTAINLTGGLAITLVLSELRVLLLAAEEAAVFLKIFDVLKPILGVISPGLITDLLPALDQVATGQTQPPVDLLLHMFFCNLTCTGASVEFTAAERTAMVDAILLNPTYWNSDLEKALLSEIMAYESLEHWQVAMTTVTTSSACDGFTCP